MGLPGEEVSVPPTTVETLHGFVRSIEVGHSSTRAGSRVIGVARRWSCKILVPTHAGPFRHGEEHQAPGWLVLMNLLEKELGFLVRSPRGRIS
jgi:hypothetical protein